MIRGNLRAVFFKKQRKKIVSQEVQEYRLRHRLTIGAGLAAVCMSGSLTLSFYPDASKKVAASLRQGFSFVQTSFEKAGNSLQALAEKRNSVSLAADSQENQIKTNSPDSEQGSLDNLDISQEKGKISDLHMDSNTGQNTGDIYDTVLGSSLGPISYYNQGDARWADYLYGGADPMHTYGCGPTTVAMLINSLSPQKPPATEITPVEMAQWAQNNGCYAPQGGSYHSLITKALSAYGLNVESVTDRSPDNAAALLQSGHVLVALMGQGSLTQNGHFIIITQLQEDGTVSIADPNSFENSSRSWDLNLLMGELKKVYDSGAPLWAVSL